MLEDVYEDSEEVEGDEGRPARFSWPFWKCLSISRDAVAVCRSAFAVVGKKPSPTSDSSLGSSLHARSRVAATCRRNLTTKHMAVMQPLSILSRRSSWRRALRAALRLRREFVIEGPADGASAVGVRVDVAAGLPAVAFVGGGRGWTAWRPRRRATAKAFLSVESNFNSSNSLRAANSAHSSIVHGRDSRRENDAMELFE